MVLDLAGELPAYVLLLIRCDLLAELKSCEPVLQVHSHLKGKLWLGALQKVVLGNIVLEKDRSNMAHQDKFLALMLDGLDRVDHAHILAHLEGGFCDRELHEFETLLSKGFEEEL